MPLSPFFFCGTLKGTRYLLQGPHSHASAPLKKGHYWYYAELAAEFKSAAISSLPLGLALGSPIFPSGCEGKLGVALESLQGLRDLT